MPIGIAHGFYVLSDSATVLYNISHVYAPKQDGGVHWTSFPDWPDQDPILSERDKQHPLLNDFENPFVYKP